MSIPTISRCTVGTLVWRESGPVAVLGDVGRYDRVWPHAVFKGRTHVDRLHGVLTVCWGDEASCCYHPGSSDMGCTAVNSVPEVFPDLLTSGPCSDFHDN